MTKEGEAMKNEIAIESIESIESWALPCRSAAGLAAMLLLLAGLTGAANAATLTITPDQTTYAVSDTITLTIVGDAQGAADYGVFGSLFFDSALATTIATTQTPLTSLGGSLPWIQGTVPAGYPGIAVAFNQIVGLTPWAPDAPLVSIITLHAAGPGTLDLNWETDPSTGNQLYFFGLSSAPGASVRIVDRGGQPIPEPTGAMVFGAGFLVMSWASRRHSTSS
jgi:hypothetical protein